jgi:hypothetical protein
MLPFDGNSQDRVVSCCISLTIRAISMFTDHTVGKRILLQAMVAFTIEQFQQVRLRFMHAVLFSLHAAPHCHIATHSPQRFQPQALPSSRLPLSFHSCIKPITASLSRTLSP